MAMRSHTNVVLIGMDLKELLLAVLVLAVSWYFLPVIIAVIVTLIVILVLWGRY